MKKIQKRDLPKLKELGFEYSEIGKYWIKVTHDYKRNKFTAMFVYAENGEIEFEGDDDFKKEMSQEINKKIKGKE